MPIGRWGTVAEAAEHFSVTRQRIHTLIGKGALGKTKKMQTPRGPVMLIRYPFERVELATGQHRDGCSCGNHKKSKGE